MLPSHAARCRYRPECETLEDRLPPGNLLFSSGWYVLGPGSDRPTAGETRSVLRLPGEVRGEKGADLTDLSIAGGAAMPVRTRIEAPATVSHSHAAAASSLPESIERTAWRAGSTGQSRGPSLAASSTGAALLAEVGIPAERINWDHALAALDRSAAALATHSAGTAENHNQALSARAPLAFDPARGWLAVWGQGAGETIREGMTPSGFLEVSLGQQVHSSDPASTAFDPALAGAGRNSLTGIRVVGNSGDAPLLLASQTLSGGLTVQSQSPIEVVGTLHAAGPVTLAAPAVTVRGQLDGTTVDLASAGLVNVTATGTVTAARVAVTAGAFLDAGQVRADGFQGGQITVQAGNVLQGGRLSADGTAADGGTVQVSFHGAYIATAAARTTADGAHGGQVRIDGGRTGQLFSSGTQEALGQAATGGLVDLGGREVVLVGATADASGWAGGGRVTVGSDGTARSVTVTATALRAAALDQGSPGPVTLGTADTAVDATPGFHLIDPHPTRTGGFGFSMTPLSNGNIVVTNPHDDLVVADGGAVYLFQGQTGALLGSLIGSAPGDRLGDPGQGGRGPDGNGPASQVASQAVVPLTNGNYVVLSPFWNNNRGAATWGDGTVGITGAVDAGNSLVGSNTGDEVGISATALANGNYVVGSPYWNGGFMNGMGAATWGDGTVGVTGAVDASNSLVGSHPQDYVGFPITALANGNYVVASELWNGGRGAATWGDGTVGITGAVDASNSLVGSNPNDEVGLRVAALTNGNYVVGSPYWNGGFGDGMGAATWADGTVGITGPVNAGNSLVGSNPGDHVGLPITALANGNYVVASELWNGSRGAVTWGDGTVGITGTVDAGNSLVGSNAGDEVGISVTALANGNYVVASSFWNGGFGHGLGAATWGDGTVGVTGPIDAGNSLVGTNPGDHVGSNITALPNSNYVVTSLSWNDSRGAATWGDGTVGITGAVDAGNSLVGSNPNDEVGIRVTVLANSNYVVTSPYWHGGFGNGMGAATWGDGTVGGTGTVDASNSLVGSNAGDQVGLGVTALANGNYVVASDTWNGQRGAATWGDGTVGVTGTIDSGNSLVGSNAGDEVGLGVTALANGNYVVASSFWNGGFNSGRGAATWGDGTVGVTGAVDAGNSLLGSNPGDHVSIEITALPNGNYVVRSPVWNNSLGAVTWGDGTAGISGFIDAGNSLVGSSSGDQIGSGAFGKGGVTALTNGNYVVASPFWNGRRGAVTWGDDTMGITGTVDISNSLVGSNTGDFVGSGVSSDGSDGVNRLPNGNYVVASPFWDSNRGAATWGDGTMGIAGAVDDTNSLVG